jgi:DHA3 family macrolide efflux protein-like MFS transporter
MTPLSLAIAGPVSDLIGIRTWYWVAGLICLLLGIGAFFTPLIMNVETNRARETKTPAYPSMHPAGD